MTPRQPTNKHKKRLVVLSDGTWQTPENPTPTNILKLTMAIEQEDPRGMQQIVFYDAGIGTQGGVDKIMGGSFGEGIDLNIKELYTFLVLNYDEGDEVYMFGFSRGSYTVRSLCGMIHESGLVRRDQLQFVEEAYDLYRNNQDINSEEAVNFREAHGDAIPIKLILCFDTVGSLGLPFQVPAFLSKFTVEQYRFHDTTLNALIENAIHMVSINEDRSERGDEQLTQLYFWGGHGGIGGGDPLQLNISDTTIRFCVEEMKQRKIGLAINLEMIPQYGDIEFEGEEISTSAVMGFFEKLTGAVLEFVGKLTGKFVRKIDSVPLGTRDPFECSSAFPSCAKLAACCIRVAFL